jgi:hypothetical protein
MHSWIVRLVGLTLAGLTPSVGVANDYLGLGTCPAGGTLSIVSTGTYKGRAFDLLKLEAFRTKYSRVFTDTDHWSTTLTGPAEENRRYTSPKGSTVVFFSCQARNCTAAQLYGVIDERTGAIGARVTDSGKVEEKGILSDQGKAAIACAQVLDVQATKRAEESVQGVKK